MHRVLQICILVGAWPLLRHSGFWSWDRLKLKSSSPLFLLGTGFMATTLFMVVYAWVLYYSGLYSTQDHLSKPIGTLVVKITATALLVSFFEEVFFRGYLYRIAREEYGIKFGLIFSMLFFAAVHYVKPDVALKPSEVTWLSGFQMFGTAFQRFDDFREIIGGLVVLMGLAWVTCVSIERTGSLYLSIGIHCGGIVVLQWCSEILRSSSNLPTWIAGGGDLSQGILLAFIFIPLWYFLKFFLEKQGLWRQGS